MPRGYEEGPVAEEAERRRDEAERGVVEERVQEWPAVYGSTADDPDQHFLGWLGDVDPDELFSSGEAWGLKIVRTRVDRV